MILADPVGSVLAPLVETGKMPQAGSWAVEGIGEDFVPPNCDLIAGAQGLFDPRSRKASPPRASCCAPEGVLGGSSSGTLLAAALRYCRAQTEPKRVVTWCAIPARNTSPRCSIPSFLAQEGWTHPDRHGTVRDVVINRFSEGTAVVGAAERYAAHGVRAHALGRRVAASGDRCERAGGRADRRERRARRAADRRRRRQRARSRAR